MNVGVLTNKQVCALKWAYNDLIEAFENAKNDDDASSIEQTIIELETAFKEIDFLD